MAKTPDQKPDDFTPPQEKPTDQEMARGIQKFAADAVGRALTPPNIPNTQNFAEKEVIVAPPKLRDRIMAFFGKGAVINNQYEVQGAPGSDAGVELGNGGNGVVVLVRDSKRSLGNVNEKDFSRLEKAALKISIESNGMGDGHYEAVITQRMRSPDIVAASGPLEVLTYSPPDNPTPWIRDVFKKAFPERSPEKLLGKVQGDDLRRLADESPDFSLIYEATLQVMDCWDGSLEKNKDAWSLTSSEKIRELLVHPARLKAFLLGGAGVRKEDVDEVVEIILENPKLLDQLTPMGMLIEIAQATTRGLYHIHYVHFPAHGHSDVKPKNILVLTLRPAEIRARQKLREYALCDFGVVFPIDKNFDDPTGKECHSNGTPGFLNPEGTFTDDRGDVFSLGSALFALATNQLPYPAVENRKPYCLPLPGDCLAQPFPLLPIYQGLYGLKEERGFLGFLGTSGYTDEALAPFREVEDVKEFIQAREKAVKLLQRLVHKMLAINIKNRIHLAGRCTKHPNGCPGGISIGHPGAIRGVMDYLEEIGKNYFYGERGMNCVIEGTSVTTIADVPSKNVAQLRGKGAKTGLDMDRLEISVIPTGKEPDWKKSRSISEATLAHVPKDDRRNTFQRILSVFEKKSSPKKSK